MFINTSGLAATFAYIYYVLSSVFAQCNQGPVVSPIGEKFYVIEQHKDLLLS